MLPRWVFLSIAAATAIFAQDKAADLPPTTTFRSDTRLVLLNVSVFDQEGKMVKDIPKTSFHIFENNEPQEIKVFRQEDAPISLGLIIDTSASMKEKWDRVVSAALAMVKASNPQDEVFILSFNETVSLRKDFTNNIQELEAALRRIEPQGETAMRDALRMGIEHLRRFASKDKKVLMVVTDGEDNS